MKLLCTIWTSEQIMFLKRHFNTSLLLKKNQFWQDDGQDKGELTRTTWKQSSSSAQLLISPSYSSISTPPSYHYYIVFVLTLWSVTLLEMELDRSSLFILNSSFLYFLLIAACFEKSNHPFMKSTPNFSFSHEGLSSLSPSLFQFYVYKNVSYTEFFLWKS